jgi:hypothetical protein
MGRLFADGQMTLTRPDGAELRMVFASGAKFVGIVREIQGDNAKVELRAAGVEGHMVLTPLAYVSEP